MPVRLPAEQPPGILPFKTAGITRPFLWMGIDPDISHSQISCIFPARIEEMPRLSESKSDRGVRTDRCTHDPARIPIDPGRDIHTPDVCSAFIYRQDLLPVYPLHRTGQPYAKQGIYYSSIFSIVRVIDNRDLIISDNIILPLSLRCHFIRFSHTFHKNFMAF